MLTQITVQFLLLTLLNITMAFLLHQLYARFFERDFTEDGLKIVALNWYFPFQFYLSCLPLTCWFGSQLIDFNLSNNRALAITLFFIIVNVAGMNFVNSGIKNHTHKKTRKYIYRANPTRSRTWHSHDID